MPCVNTPVAAILLPQSHVLITMNLLALKPSPRDLKKVPSK